MEITREVARKVLSLVDMGLTRGKGEPEPGKMCIEAVVCYALGMPHGDQPICVAPSLREFKIGLNDADWSSNAARAAGLRRLALVQLGSADTLDECEFVRRLVDCTIRQWLPKTLRRAADRFPKIAAALHE